MTTEPPPEAIFGGCDELAGSTCTLEGVHPIHAWLDVHPATPLRVLADGEPVPSGGRVIQGGVRLRVEVPPDARSLRVESTEAAWDPPVELELVRVQPPKLGAKLDAARLRERATQSTGWEKLRILDKLRRTLGTGAAAVEVADEEIELARELDAPMHQTYGLAMQAMRSIRILGDLPQARDRLAALEQLAGRSPLAAARWHYYSGLFARQTDDLGAALDHLSAARALYEKLGDEASVLDPLEMEAITLAELGRSDEARTRAEQAFAPALSRSLNCATRVRRINNFGWSELVLASSGLAISDPRPQLEHALVLNRDCYDSWDETSLLISLAMAEQQDGRPTHALGWLSLIHDLPPDLRPWVEEVEARASSRVGRGRTLLEKPTPTPDPQLAWNQAVRRADALAAWGFGELAAAAYREAEALLTDSANRVGVDPNTALYLAGRTASADGLVESLLGLGRVEEAACAVRLARARELARIDRVARLQAATAKSRTAWSSAAAQIALEQRAIEGVRGQLWGLSGAERLTAETRLDERVRATESKLDAALRGLGIEPTPTTCEELRSPAPGEVILVVYGERAFAIASDDVAVADRDQLSELDALGDASLISVVEVGERSEVPIHALPWRDAAALIDLAPVAYSLDLRPRARTERSQDVLLVADPRGDLRLAAQEAERAHAVLERRGHTVTTLAGDDATRDRVIDRLGATSLFHYAGHGTREGLSGWDSALWLAADEQLGIADVLTLPQVPQGVVLTGCETAAATPRTIGGGMNIARAFVLAGSRWVIAADDDIPDAYASELGAMIHDSAATDGPAMLRDALLQLRERDADGPWQRFRVVTP